MNNFVHYYRKSGTKAGNSSTAVHLPKRLWISFSHCSIPIWRQCSQSDLYFLLWDGILKMHDLGFVYVKYTSNSYNN